MTCLRCGHPMPGTRPWCKPCLTTPPPHTTTGGLTDTQMAHWHKIAGDGDLDQRCRRILAFARERWWGHPYVDHRIAA